MEKNGQGTKLSEYLGAAKAFFKSKQGAYAIVAIGVAGMLLIGLNSFLGKGADSNDSAPQVQDISMEEYAAQLEDKVGDLLKSIEGVGNSKVMITMESAAEYVFAQEEKSNTDRTQDYDEESPKRVTERTQTENTVILVGSGKEALVKTQIQPKVKGVAVVCDGGDSPVIQQRVTQAVSTVLDVLTSQVMVTKLK